MPLLSVVIPTRNRTKYLLDSVHVALDTIDDVEIVISDNSDDDGLRAQLAAVLETGKVKYLYSAAELSVVGNFEQALAATSGDYVMFIGDDDAVGPGVENVVRWAQAQQIDAVISYRNAFIASYFWPGVRSKYFGDAYASQLFVNRFSGEAVAVDPVEALRGVAGRLGGGLGNLPRAYHGLVSRQLIERIRQRHGHLFGGVSPDIYSATLIASECERAYIVDYPFVIPGASPSSTAGQGAERSDRGKLRATEHISRFGDGLVWDARIPEFYSPHTVWAYSLCRALERVPQLKVRPAYGQLYASCFLYYRQHYPELFQAMRALAQEQGRLRVGLQFAGGLIKEAAGLVRRVATRLLNPRAGGAAQRFGRHDTISAAYAALVKHIADSGVTLSLGSGR